MKYWLTTDSHFGHAKMKEYCGRPDGFGLKIWKGLMQIPKEDILIHLGDICVGNDAKWHNMYIQTLFCRKWLVRGNHDRKSDSWYLNNGWDFVCERFTGNFFKTEITFSHCPVEINSGINIHGHFHNNLFRLQKEEWVIEGEKERNEKDLKVLTKNHKLIALEYTNYQPIVLELLISKLL